MGRGGDERIQRRRARARRELASHFCQTSSIKNHTVNPRFHAQLVFWRGLVLGKLLLPFLVGRRRPRPSQRPVGHRQTALCMCAVRGTQVASMGSTARARNKQEIKGDSLGIVPVRRVTPPRTTIPKTSDDVPTSQLRTGRSARAASAITSKLGSS